MEMLEIVHTPDTFASGLGTIDCLDGFMRLIWYVEEWIDGRKQKVVVARLVLPKTAARLFVQAIESKLAGCPPCPAKIAMN